MKPRSFLIDGSATFTIVMSRTIIRKPAQRINSANHLRSLVVSTGMSGLLAISRGEVDMLVRPQRPEKSSVLSPPRLRGRVRVGADRAPLLVVTPPGHATRTTQARWAAAPPAPRLLLLPSGPDRVHGTRSRRTRPSTQSHETTLRTAHHSTGSSTPLKRIAGTGHRWLPV